MNLAPLQKLVPELTGQKLVAVTAPGGRQRESVRVQTKAGTVIATCRKDAALGKHEAELLARLSGVTDLVPQSLGYRDGYLLQTDLGARRLSLALQGGSQADQQTLARRAIHALAKIQQAANATDWMPALPAIFSTDVAITGLVRSVPQMCGALKLPIPSMDLDEIAARLSVPATSFVKWDARSGNAVVLSDKKVGWFDLEWAGRRCGLEDFAWFYGDEFWPVAPDQTLALTQDICREVPHLNDALIRHGIRLIATLAVLLTARRVLHLYVLFRKGQGQQIHAQMRMDLPGAHPELMIRLCKNGDFLAGLDPELQGFAELFRDLSSRIEA